MPSFKILMYPSNRKANLSFRSFLSNEIVFVIPDVLALPFTDSRLMLSSGSKYLYLIPGFTLFIINPFIHSYLVTFSSATALGKLPAVKDFALTILVFSIVNG